MQHILSVEIIVCKRINYFSTDEVKVLTGTPNINNWRTEQNVKVISSLTMRQLSTEDLRGKQMR